MSQPHPEWLILAVTLIALALAPLASKLVRQVGEQVSADVGVDNPADDLHDEIRQVVVAANERRERMGEETFDVDAEVARRIAALRDGI